MITAKLITDAWAHCRTTNNSIPDEVLDFMKDVSLAALHSQNSGKPLVSGSLPLTIVDSEKKLNEYAQKMNLDFTKPQDFALGWRYCFEWLAGRQ